MTGEGLIRGRRMAVVLCEFRSWPARSGGPRRAVVTAVDGRPRRAALLAAPVSGGTRMQEGTRLRADGEDLRGDRGAQGGRAAIPGLPAAPDDRRRVRVVGIARARHGRRAGGAGRVPGTAGLRGAVRPALPRGRPGLGEPLRTWPHRRRRRRPRTLRRGARPGAASCGAAATGVVPLPTPPARTSRVDAWESISVPGEDRPGVRRLLKSPPRRDPFNGTGRGRVRSRTAARAGAVRRAPACCSARTGAGSHRPPARSRRAARGQARHAAGRRARPAAAHRDRHPGSTLSLEAEEAGWPARSPAASPNW